jgi:polysaccharide export outer membrane protein
MKILVLVLFTFLSACSYLTPFTPSSPDVAKASDTPATPADIYIIQPGDILQVDVWKEKDLQREFMVQPDGGINFPLAGSIDAAGKTIEQLQKELATKLAKFVPDPVVTLSVKQSLGNKIYIIGKVFKPADYVVYRNTDIMQALTMAGGLTPYAAENKIKILRRVNGKLIVIPFKYSRVEKGEDLEQNILLQGGDVVIVP